MKKTFSGVLATPLSSVRPGSLEGALRSAHGHDVMKARAQEVHSKLILLCKFYGIAEGPHAFAELSLALAREFVPGFREPKKRGRSSKWTILSKGALVVEIERLIERAGTDIV